jgi:hypothetical protein
MIFRNLTKMDNKTYINIKSPLSTCIGWQFPAFRAIAPTFSIINPHNGPKSLKFHQPCICRGRLCPVYQRTRTHIPNYLAFQNASILPIGGACRLTPFLSHLRTLAYWLRCGRPL